MFTSIVVGTDGSETAAEAVRQAVDMARALEVNLTLVSAYDPMSAQAPARAGSWQPASARVEIDPHAEAESLLADEADARREAGVAVSTCARRGDPSNVILDVAEEREADLIVVGSQGMTGASRFLLGSVPNKVSHHAPCSVLIVRTS